MFIYLIAEGDLIRAARLRELFGIKEGQTVESAIHFRDKLKMKEKLQEHQIKVPTFMRADTATDILKFAEEKGFPFVIKPSCGYSSVNTVAIKNKEDLEHYFSSGVLDKLQQGMDVKLGVDIESFVFGPMYHIDGMIVNNQPFCMWPSKYLNTCIDLV